MHSLFSAETSGIARVACARRALAQLGIQENPETLMVRLPAQEGEAALIALFRSRGLFVHVENGGTLLEAAQLMSEGTPVIVRYGKTPYYGLILEIGKHHILLHDHQSESPHHMPSATFERIWQGAEDGRGWLLAISKEPFGTGGEHYPRHVLS